MAQLYNDSLSDRVRPQEGPKETTIKFLINYSKALNVTKVNDMTFEIFKN